MEHKTYTKDGNKWILKYDYGKKRNFRSDIFTPHL